MQMFYYGWVFVLIVHVSLNFIIYDIVTKDEPNRTLPGYYNFIRLLSLFTFRWSSSFHKDESEKAKRMMRISNKLSIVLIIYTVAVFLVSIFTY